MLTARNRVTQNAHVHLLSVPAGFASSPPTPFMPPWASSLLYAPHLLITHCPLGGPPNFPGLCCVGESALGCPLNRAGRGVSNPLALLTLLVPFPPLASASRSKKPRRDTSRRYCMGHVPSSPPFKSQLMCHHPAVVPGSDPGAISALTSPLLPGRPPSAAILLLVPPPHTPPLLSSPLSSLLRLHAQPCFPHLSSRSLSLTSLTFCLPRPRHACSPRPLPADHPTWVPW